METTQPSSLFAKRWKSLASQTANRINLAWWWQSAGPLLAGLAGVGCAAVLYLRSSIIDFDLKLAAIGLAATMLVCALGAWIWARRRFISRAEGMVQLEHRMKLHNALSAADAGITNWPEPPPAIDLDDGLRWKRAHVVVPSLIFLCCLALAFLLPVTPPDNYTPPVVPPPTAMQAAESMIKELEKADVARKEDLSKFQEALDELKQRSPDEWYNHSSLEAADHLKESISKSASELSQNYGKTQKSLEKLTDADAPKSAAEKEQAAKDLANALQGLQNGAMQPNKELMDKLKSLDPEQLQQQLSKEELEQLKEELKRRKEAAQQGGDPAEGEGQEGPGSEEQAMRDAVNGKDGEGEGEGGDGNSNGEGEDGEGEGKQGAGPPTRGPGTVDLKPKKSESDLDTNNPEKEQTRDIKRLAPGDLLGTSDGEHDVDKTIVGPQSGGNTANKGEGGDAVQRENLLPEEKRVLKKFFK